MTYDETKDLVLKHVQLLEEQFKKEHTDKEFAPFPKLFIKSIEDYIWNSLAGVFTMQPKESTNALATILMNVAIIEKLPEEVQFDAFQELSKMALQADTDFTEFFFKKNPQMRREISCKKGCAWCCHQEVQLNGIEAKHFWKIVPRGGRFEKQVAESQFNMKSDYEGNPQVPYVKRLGMEDSKCPFLATDNTCSVYETRPLVCRYYEVYDDPRGCHPYTLNEVQTMRLPIFVAIMEAAAFEAFGFTTLQKDGHIVMVQKD